MASCIFHELFSSFLGFTGDIIIDDGKTFRIRDGFSLEREAERHQINSLVPLGWFYMQLNSLVDKYSVRWGITHNDSHFELYKAAVAQGVDDLLHEYVNDVSYIDQLVLSEGAVPLSHVWQHVQKVVPWSRILLPYVYLQWCGAGL